MIYWLRYAWLFLKGIIFANYFEKHQRKFDEEHVYDIMVLPFDLGAGFHLNNGQYLVFLEHARFDMIIKHANIFNMCQKAGFSLGWLVGGCSFQFRRSAHLFDKVRIKSKMICADERWIYVEQRMYVKDSFLGKGIIRMCCTDSKGAVSTKRYFKEILGLDIETQDAKFRMNRDQYKKSLTQSIMDGPSEDVALDRVSSFVHHDETLKEK